MLTPFHIDCRLEALAAGELSPAQHARLRRHASRCPRCSVRYERTVLALRELERGRSDLPAEVERTAVASHLDRLVRTGAPPRPWSAPVLGLGAAAAIATAVALLLLPEREWTARGDGEGRAVLRIFCDRAGGTLEPISPDGSCPVGARLAFAAGAVSPLSHVVVAVVGPGSRTSESFRVEGRPGRESPLDFTPVLEAPGSVLVRAGFGDSAEAARAALEGGRGQGTVLLRQQIRAEARP